MRENRTSGSMSGVEETGLWKASVSAWAKAHSRSRLRPSFRYRASRRLSTHDVPSYIYWGSPTGFAPYLRSGPQGFGAAAVSVADLNLDGKPEVLLVNQYSGRVEGKVLSTVFWGNPHSYYSAASMTSLPSAGAYDTT